MSIPELDLKKVNLQSAVGYLISLHDNEVDWNLLGIRVIGAIDALPIPDGDYEYGDAYMVGTSTPYDMYIYTRPDGAVHTEGYWFPIGKFPTPGPQGPKGDGFETVYQWVNGTVQRVDYDTTSGARISQQTTVEYYPTDAGSSTFKTFETVSTLPIVPGKYISIDANSESDAIEVKVDDTQLALDYIKIDKSKNSVVPQYDDGKIKWTPLTGAPLGSSIVARDGSGNTYLNKLFVNSFAAGSGGNPMDYYAVYNNTQNTEFAIDKTSTDTGTLTTTQLSQLYGTVQANNRHIIYDGQCYHRMDPTNAPDGTLNYIHIDSLQDGSGRYKATGKCFSITVSTRAWQVIDIDFGPTTHNVTIDNSATGQLIYLTVNSSQTAQFADGQELFDAIQDKTIPCVVTTNDTNVTAGIITTESTYFKVSYGTEVLQMTPSQIGVIDN